MSSPSDSPTKMTYRFFLGNSGLLYKEETTVDAWYEMMKTAFTHDINFFDTSEIREDLVLTTKIFLGYKGIETAGPNDQGLSRKHIIKGMKASLRRMELDYVDVLFCHRPDPHTPIRDCACHELRYLARMSLLLEHQRVAAIRLYPGV
ncbi:hypothetical protein JG688_00013401 [Phytophthora aleatoria]|uniref:NADP-dependent oxidoreductase domain-containing protein n=1 Tax=Phytophthora aleatoria TaxID=2496075 RepID=A0A8J5MEE5_9STRA|nr:hypothetical protein JG688_00013401 [Phytophthora aleatoria]